MRIIRQVLREKHLHTEVFYSWKKTEDYFSEELGGKKFSYREYIEVISK